MAHVRGQGDLMDSRVAVLPNGPRRMTTATPSRDSYPILALIVFFVAGLSMFAGAAPAAAASIPPDDYSYYVTALNPNTASTQGCKQGNYDSSHGRIDSTVTLDFGGQNSSNTGTYLTFSNTSVSYSSIESYAETFAYNYWLCTGTDTTSNLTMSIGTNNSAYYVNSTGGSTWGTVVNTVINYLSSNSIGQVVVWGANDMELDWNSYSATYSWKSGYASRTSALYNNYGDAAGCPPYGSRDNGWSQADVWYLSWGASDAEATPEIYYVSQGNEWVAVSNDYGLGVHGARIVFWAPWDEYDLDSNTLTPTGAWYALQCNGSQLCIFAIQIHRVS